MNSEIFTPGYWNNRYNINNDTWTLNNPNPVLIQLFDEKRVIPGGKALVAGSGKGDDAIFIAEKGFEVTGADFSREAVLFSSQKAQNKGISCNFIQMDLFELKPETAGEFDFIYEYVTFCSIEKGKIEELLGILASLLKRGGIFATVLFPVDGRPGGPPFAIDINEFYVSASKFLKLEYYSKIINSVKPRKGNEVLFIFRKI